MKPFSFRDWSAWVGVGRLDVIAAHRDMRRAVNALAQARFEEVWRQATLTGTGFFRVKLSSSSSWLT